MRITVIAGVLVAAAWLAGARAEDGVDVLASGVRGVSIAASGDGARLVVLGAEGTVRVLASADGTEIASLPGAKARRAWFVGPDGSLVATAGEDVAVWSVPKQKVLRRIAPSVMSAADRAGRYDDGCGWFAAAASPRDKTIATLGFDGRVALWSMATDRDAGSIQSDGQGKAAAFSFDGTKLAAVVQRAGEARSLVVFDLSRRAVSWRPPIADKSDPGIELWRWSEATFSGDGKTLYAACMQPRFGGAAGEDGLVRAFDLTRSKPLWTRRFEDDAVLRTACSAKGGRIAVATRRGVALLDPATGATTAILGGAADAPSDIAFSPDGSVLYCVGGGGGVVRRRMPDAGAAPTAPEPTPELRFAPFQFVHEASVAAFSPDGKSLLTLEGGPARIYDAAKGTLRREFTMPGGGANFAAFLGEDADLLLLRAADDSRAYVAPVATGEPIAVIDARLVRKQGDLRAYTLSCVAADPRRRQAAVGFEPMGAPDLDAPFVVFDVASGSATAPPALIAPELMHPRPRIAAFSADGLRLAAVFANDHGAALAVWRRPDLKSPWNAPTYSWSGVVGEGLYWNEIGFQPDGGGVATFGNSRTGDGRAVLVLWRTETNAAPWIGATRSGWGDGMAVSPRGDAVAIATDDGTALFDPSTGAQTLKLPRTKVPIEGLAFSPSGDRLYAAMGRALVYWDLGPKK